MKLINYASEIKPLDFDYRFFRPLFSMGIIAILFFLMTACDGRVGLAPVSEPNWRAYSRSVKQYTVVKGDTLYSIAFRYDLDYQQMATFNHLKSPYTVRVGQVLRLMPLGRHHPKRGVAAYSRPKVQHRAIQHPRKVSFPVLLNSSWLWPAHGRVVAHFAPQNGMKGINIAGKKGDNVYAASNGIVAYSGSGLAGYGNLIIIKHGSQYMTAYGNNLNNLVHEGNQVKKGQVIAKMGTVDRHYWGVHFEIRQLGQPVDPLRYIH